MDERATPPNFGTILDVRGIAVVASLARVAAPNLNNQWMREAQENDFEFRAAFKLQPQPEIWRIARHPPNFGTISDVRGITVVASLARVAAPNLNNR